MYNIRFTGLKMFTAIVRWQIHTRRLNFFGMLPRIGCLTFGTLKFGERYSSHTGQGRAQLPNALRCSLQPKICKYVDVSPRVQDIQHFYDLSQFRFCLYCKLFQCRVSANVIRDFFPQMCNAYSAPAPIALRTRPLLAPAVVRDTSRQDVRPCTTL